jgi:hypothetical protein
VASRNKHHNKAVLSLPSSSTNASTLVAEQSVRHSSRISSTKAGFHPVRIDKNPSKKRKIGAVQIDKAIGKAGPVPMEILQSWGIDCGVPPTKLSNETLMCTPAAVVDDE